MVPSADKTAKSVNGVNAAAAGITGSVGGAAAAIRPFNSAVASAAAGANGLGKAGLMTGTAMGTVERAAVSAAGGLNVMGLAANRAGMMMQAADAHVKAYRNSLATLPAATQQAKSGLDRLGAAANDNINRLQSTPGNIAAQFQDIGVTAAGGMSPLLIALQQGTQLSAAMAGGLRPLLGGILQLLSPVTLLTIALVGLAAAGLQSIDWMSVGQTALNGLADALEVAAPYAAALGATLLLAFAPQIIAGIYAASAAIIGSLVPAIGTATGALIAFAIANPFTAIILAIALVAAAVYGLSKVFGGVFSEIVDFVYKAVNSIIAGFVGGFNGIKAAWSKLPAALGDLVLQTVNLVISGVETMVNASINLINGLTSKLPFGIGDSIQMGGVSFGRVDNPYAGAASSVNDMVKAAVKAADKVDYIGKGMGAVRDAAKGAAGWLRGIAGGMGAENGKPKKGGADGADPKGRTPKAEKTIAEKFDEILGDASKQMRALNQAGAQVGIYGEALAQLKYQQELFNAAQDKGIPLIDATTGKLNAYGQQLLKISETMAAQNEANRKAQFIEDMAVKLEEQQRVLNQSRGEIGLTGAALAAYRFEQELLNSAIAAHIALTPAELDAIHQASVGYGEQSEAIRKMKENLEFTRDTVKGFFTDFFDGLRQGESLFKSFGDAVLNTLNKIIDKLQSNFIDNFINSFIGNLGSSFGGASGGSSGGGGFVGKNALGNAFGGSGVIPFARGGSFTNSVVSSPTLFAFGKGGSKLGIMGEAGDEAILPLKRGPDGSLGVQSGGGGSRGGTVIQAPIQVENRFILDGAISPETIVKMIQQGGARTKAEVERGLMDTISRIQRDGATV